MPHAPSTSEKWLGFITSVSRHRMPEISGSTRGHAQMSNVQVQLLESCPRNWISLVRFLDLFARKRILPCSAVDAGISFGFVQLALKMDTLTFKFAYP